MNVYLIIERDPFITDIFGEENPNFLDVTHITLIIN